MTMKLERLLHPKSIAIVGGAWTQNVLFQIRKWNFEGPVWHVNPKSEFKKITDLPYPPDAAFVAVNRHASIDITRSLAQFGAGGAICFASGFGEAGEEGAFLQDTLLEAAGEMPILGPNCYGMVNYLDGVAIWPDVLGGYKAESGVALITQSSNILISMSMQQRGLPIAYMLAAGNGAQLGLSELIAAMDEDPRVTAIGLHIEGFGDPSSFHQAARDCSKPIIALKSGETKAARTLTVSHTASLSGSDSVADAFLNRCGIGRVRSLESFLEGLKILHLGGKITGKDLLSISCSGGEASLMADAGARYGFNFPSMDGLGIDETLNPLVKVSNPFDYHTFEWGNAEALTPAFTKALRGPQNFTIFVFDWPRKTSGNLESFELAIECIINAKRASDARVGIMATYPENMPEDLSQRLVSVGIVPLHGMQASLEGLGAAALQHGTKFQYLSKPQKPLTSLTEYDSKQELASSGISIPSGHLVSSVDQITELKKPFVMKAVSVDLFHKSELGGVSLNVTDPLGVFAKLSKISETILVEEMVQDVTAELIVGFAHDPVIGGHMLIGSGGILAELMEDSAILLLPFDQNQAEEALNSLRISKILDGYRGRPSANRLAIIQTLMAVQTRIMRGDVLELDINPLIATPADAVAADAMFILGEPS